MIIGIGIDSIEIARFADWHTRPHNELRKLFSDAEIAYCLSSPTTAAERFAVRFAAKEALFKALSNIEGFKIPFLSLCKVTSIEHSCKGIPTIKTPWDSIIPESSALLVYSIKAHVSLSHSDTMATAMVVLEK